MVVKLAAFTVDPEKHKEGDYWLDGLILSGDLLDYGFKVEFGAFGVSSEFVGVLCERVESTALGHGGEC